MIYWWIGLKNMSDLMLSKELYSKNIIDRACHDYIGITDISVKEFGAYYIVVFKNCKYPEQITRDEFENYIIDLTGKK